MCEKSTMELDGKEGCYFRASLFAMRPPSRVPRPPSPFPLFLRQQLLEEVERARVVRLAEPEQCLLSYLRILVRSRHRDQCRNAFLARTLRECEHRGLTDFAIDGVVADNVVEASRRRVAGGLAKPEHRRSSCTAWDVRIARDLDQCGPNVGAVGECRREDRLLPHAASFVLRQRDEIFSRFSRRHHA